MSLTPSNMMPLGTIAPDFTLTDTVSDADVALSDFNSKAGTLIMFICNHCPYVKHVNNELVRLGNDYADKINIIAISSNDAENYPEDSPEKMKEYANALGYSFPYLYDESQEVAKAYMAACTPEFYLFDAEKKCVYRGQLDGSRPGSGTQSDGSSLRPAIENLIAGKQIDGNQVPSIGCNIKWK